jgi:hypothetical protein
MRTVIKEHNWLAVMPRGWGNGYVIIDQDHKFHGYDYDHIDQYVEVHGGLTFGQIVDKNIVECFDLEESYIGKWIIGFDTCHWGDTQEEWTKERVQQEADGLMKQLEALI